jgi:hypothetical protein
MSSLLVKKSISLPRLKSPTRKESRLSRTHPVFRNPWPMNQIDEEKLFILLQEQDLVFSRYSDHYFPKETSLPEPEKGYFLKIILSKFLLLAVLMSLLLSPLFDE